MRFVDIFKRITGNEGLLTMARLSSILLCFIYLDFTFKQTTSIPFKAYETKFVFDDLLIHLFSQSQSLLFIPLLILLVWRRNHLLKSWTIFDHYRPLRLLTIVPVILLTWIYSTYSFNFFYNQSHLIDRSILIILGLIIWKRPIFIFPFILQLFSIIHQNDILPSSMWTEIYLPFHIILLVFCYFLLYNKFGKTPLKILVPGIVIVYLSHYFPSGFFKLHPSWILHDQVASLLPSTYSSGWLGFVSIKSIEKITNFLMQLNPILRIFVVLIEFGCVFSLLRRKLFITSIIGFVIFHFCVLFLSGIFFWSWIIIGVLLLYLFTKQPSFRTSFAFSRNTILVAGLFLIFSIPWKSFPALFWFNSPLGYAYQIEGITGDGNVKILMPQFFDPTYVFFAVQDYKFLTSEKRLGITWGGTNQKVAKFVRPDRAIDEIFHFEIQNGKSFFDKSKVKRFENYIQRFIRNWNHNKTTLLISHIKAPPTILTSNIKSETPQTEKIIKVNIMENTFIYQNQQLQTLRTKLLHSIQIE